jgi:hypothetical protein
VGEGLARISWLPSADAETHAVTRGLLSLLGPGQYGACLASGVSGTALDDGDIPPLGDGFAYLVQGESSGCGAGSLGQGSLGERVNDDPAACD